MVCAVDLRATRIILPVGLQYKSVNKGMRDTRMYVFNINVTPPLSSSSLTTNFVYKREEYLFTLLLDAVFHVFCIC